LSAPDGDAGLRRIETREWVNAHVGRLTPRLQAYVWAWAERRTHELAATMHVSEEAVRKGASRAIAQVRQMARVDFSG
jgi:hypothetical protein